MEEAGIVGKRAIFLMCFVFVLVIFVFDNLRMQDCWFKVT